MNGRCRACEQAAAECVLPCEHAFCARCLHLWVGVYVDQYRGAGRGWDHFPCQMCWTKVDVPDGGLSTFKREGLAMSNLMEQLAQLTVRTESSCGPCRAGASAHSAHSMDMQTEEQQQQLLQQQQQQQLLQQQQQQQQQCRPMPIEMDMQMQSYQDSLPPGQRRLCFPSCHSYNHHMC